MAASSGAAAAPARNWRRAVMGASPRGSSRQALSRDLQGHSRRAGKAFGQAHLQPTAAAAEGQGRGRSERLDTLDGARRKRRILREGRDVYAAAGGPAQRDRIQGAVLRGEAEIIRSEGLRLALAEHAAGHLRRPFTEAAPGARPVDRVAVAAHPGAHLVEEPALVG